MSTVIKGGTLVNAARSFAADLKIEGERIVAVGQGLDGDEVMDASGCFVMPGGIDPHTHLEMPFMGTTSADNYESGTKAALSGGTTMVVDFCIPGHGQKLMDAWADWDRRSAGAAADYSYHMCIVSWSDAIREEMAEVVRRGVTTFKHFMAYKGALMVNDEEMFASFKRCAEIGGMPLVHAENGDVVAALQAEMLRQGITGPEGHGYSRPPEVEGEAANRAIMLADQAGVPLYIVHTSSIEAHEAIRRARSLGQRVYGEPLIQHLVLDETEYLHPDLGPCGTSRDVAAVSRQEEPGRPVERPEGRLTAGGGDRPLRLHNGAEALGAARLHPDPERYRRARGPHAGALDARRRHRPADDERVRGRDLDQHRPHPQSLP